MSGIDAAIPPVADRMKELFPHRDHGRPITVSVRQRKGDDPFPIERLLDKIRDLMGKDPVTVFDAAPWLRTTYPHLASGTVRAILGSEQGRTVTQVTFVILPSEIFSELSEVVLGKKSDEKRGPVVEIEGVYLDGVFETRRATYHSPT